MYAYLNSLHPKKNSGKYIQPWLLVIIDERFQWRTHDSFRIPKNRFFSGGQSRVPENPFPNFYKPETELINTLWRVIKYSFTLWIWPAGEGKSLRLGGSSFITFLWKHKTSCFYIVSLELWFKCFEKEQFVEDDISAVTMTPFHLPSTWVSVRLWSSL